MSNITEVDSEGVFELLSTLCNNVSAKYSQGKSRIQLSNKMRTHAYEIILKKSSKDIPTCSQDAVTALLTYYLIAQQNVKNVVQFKNNLELKKAISNIRCTDFGDQKENIYMVLKFLVALGGSVEPDSSTEIFKKPFTYGLLDKMLPRPPRLSVGSPDPYPCYPASVFQLPYSIKKEAQFLDNNNCSKPSTQFSLESFTSQFKSCDTFPKSGVRRTASTLLVTMPSTSTNIISYSEPASILNFGRLTGPRDLMIPKTFDPKVVVTLPETVEASVEDVYMAKTEAANQSTMDIWEIATQIDKNIPTDLWDVVSKLPPLNDRQLIATSAREMGLWKQMYSNRLTELNVISEKQFVRHVVYLLIGIETSSFTYNTELNYFQMKPGLVLEGISQSVLAGYVLDLLLVGTYYRRLYNFAFSQMLEDLFESKGLVYEAGREVVRRYLLQFRMKITDMCSENSFSDDQLTMPTLLQILYEVEPLKYEIETIVGIYKLMDTESESKLPVGAELMSYLFNEISLVTHEKTALTMYTALFSICKVYCKFIENFIFEGELNDQFNEFFIRKDSNYVNCRSKRYWDKGFHITKSVAVPDFLKSLAKLILLCGKSLRLLKLCNPSDPLILLISSDHPSVKCCPSFAHLDRQQQLLSVYRTRCLFVSGEPVTFDQILLKKEADRKAFTEMAAMKQAETMDKIVAERKRLAQLIIAEKQHSLRVLEAAMAEAKAAKLNSKYRQKRLQVLEHAAGKAAEEVDHKLKEDERHKMMEYYSKLNMEVEKSKIHAEWKIKRLQLDQSRMQLLSSEERNLRREKLELQHKQNEECMAMSIQSIDTEERSDNEMEKSVENIPEVAEVITENPLVTQQKQTTSEFDANKHRNKRSNEVFSAICNVAKSIFGVSKDCDNEKELDSQGNVLPTVSEIEVNSNKPETEFHDAFDNEQFLNTRHEAIMNKQKVMAHEFGRTDIENNKVTDVDEENNIQPTTFTEAKKNKLKVLGTEYNLARIEKIVFEPKTDAQKEALLNKQKILGAEFYLPPVVPVIKEPMNVAQEEAIRNKHKVLKGEFDPVELLTMKRQPTKRSNLTLNLKPFGETAVENSGTTPNIGATTPGELFPRLDLETPTTADVQFTGGTGDIFSPRSDAIKDDDSEESKSDKKITDGFDFTIIVDEDTIDNEIIDLYTPQNSPVKQAQIKDNLKAKYSVFDVLEGTYNLEDFDPFGVKDLKKFSTDFFANQLDVENSNSVYPHPALIMAEVKKKPYENIFIRNSPYVGYNDEDQEITSDNIATLTACLQRSVMLPLTYQLEVVNNSILTYFLVNLDMYEHMKSLKDYFFLMDGEFSRSICHNLFKKLGSTLNPKELLNFATLHSILDKALGSSISHIHKFSENLSFTISDTPPVFQHNSPDVLQCLSLTYTVEWPLNIILSQEALARYAKVFQFLVKMRRVSWVLSEGFEALKLTVKLSKSHARRLIRSPQYISVQIYRHNMAALIRSLDNYIVTTCILSSWTEFETDLKKARTLDDLYECHVVYIKKVLFRCLLNNRSTPVMKILNDIFTVILKFTRVLKAGEWQQKQLNGEFSHSSHAQLVDLYFMFEKLAKYLHKVITKLMECGYQRHLVELLTLINLNQYYEPDKNREDTNTSIQSTV